MLNRLVPWLYWHRRVRRAWIIAQTLWAGWIVAFMSAPNAAASGLTAALSWSGLQDSRGVPIGAYFFSTVDMIEAMKNQGNDMSLTKPSSWIPSLADNITVALTYSQVAAALGACTGFLLFICSIGIWIIKFALGTTWLMWLAAIATPIVANINAILSQLHVVPTALTICLFIGGVIALTKGVGRGLGIMASGFVVILLTAWLLRDPVTELTSPDGVLGMGRWLGFTVAMGVANNGPIVTDGSSINDAQVNHLSAWMVDVLARDSLQLMNFGQVIDARPGCAQAWDTALMMANRTAEGPAKAIRACGAEDAYAHAQQIGGESVGLFFLLNLVVMTALLALCYVAVEVLRVGFKAFWNVLILVPAAAVAIAPGPQRQFAKKSALRAVVHGLEMLFVTAGLGVLLILMHWVMQGNLAGGMQVDSPILKLLLLVLLSWAGSLAFRKMLHAFGDGGLPGPVAVAKGLGKAALHAGMPLAQSRMYRNGAHRLGHELGPSDSTHLPGQSTEQGSTGGPPRPGRRGHPPVSSSGPSAPPSSPSGSGAGTTAPRRPGGGGGGSAATATARSAGTPSAAGAPAAETAAGGKAAGTRAATASAGRTAAGGTARGAAAGGATAGGSAAAAETAAAVAAPEVVAAGLVAKKAASVAHRHHSPGRSSAGSTPTDAPRQDPATPQEPKRASNTAADKPDRAELVEAHKPTTAAPPPQRSTPTPKPKPKPKPKPTKPTPRPPS